MKDLKKLKQKGQKGFTLIELMVVLAIVGIMVAVAMPMYSQYTRKTNFSNLMGMTHAYTKAVGVCINETGAPAGCDGGTNNIPADLGAAGFLTSLQTANGVITVVSTIDTSAVNNATYTLTPVVNGGIITWTEGGTCGTDPDEELC